MDEDYEKRFQQKAKVCKKSNNGRLFRGVVVQKILVAPCGDAPRDQKWINEGFRYYEKKK